MKTCVLQMCLQIQQIARYTQKQYSLYLKVFIKCLFTSSGALPSVRLVLNLHNVVRFVNYVLRPCP